MPKNIVICCDGTGNVPGSKRESNVARLAQMIISGDHQRLFYDVGVGTVGSEAATTAVGKAYTKSMGLIAGHGLKQNIASAYRFIMQNWEPGDKIYMFGFSRGAFAVRSVAGLLMQLGLLEPGNEHLVPYMIRALYAKGRSRAISMGESMGLSDAVCRDDFPVFSDAERNPPIHFVGLWDTVSTVGLFGRGAGWPYTGLKNAQHVRHAVALDEWRWAYRPLHLPDPHQPGKDHPEVWSAGAHADVRSILPLDPSQDKRDHREVWFAGVHSDVGGGYRNNRELPEYKWRGGGSELADLTLQWIGTAAIDHGLDVREEAGREDAPDSSFGWFRKLPADRAVGRVSGLKPFWLLTGRHRRRMPTEGQGPTVHESVINRMNSSEMQRTRYRKRGITEATPVEPWPREERTASEAAAIEAYYEDRWEQLAKALNSIAGEG